MSKLSAAIDIIQGYVDEGQPIPVYCHEEVREILDAAWCYVEVSH